MCSAHKSSANNIVIIQCHPVFPAILIKGILVIHHIHQHTQDILINICSSKCQLVTLDIPSCSQHRCADVPTNCSNFTALPSDYRWQFSSSGKVYTLYSRVSLWESSCNNTITQTIKQLRAGLDGHRSAQVITLANHHPMFPVVTS